MHLVQVTKEIRLILKIGAVFAVLGIVVFLAFQGGTIIKRVFYPTPPPPPGQKFGKLPSLQFSSVQPLTYQINTVSGNLPEFPDRVSVFEISKSSANILALQNVRKRIGDAGFTTGETKVAGKDTVYQWTNPTTNGVIIYDLLTNNFTVQSNYLTNVGISLDTSFPDNGTIVDYLKDFLGAVQANIADIDSKKTVVKLYAVNGQQLTELKDNLTTAKVAKVILYQGEIKVDPFIITDTNSTKFTTLPIYYNTPDESNIMFTLTQTKDGVQVVEGQFYHYVVDTNSSSTYPIKTAKQAFDDLEKGNAKVFYTGSSETIDITDVKFAYFLGKDNPSYLQPIYIFTGKNNFSAYVHAISSGSIE